MLDCFVDILNRDFHCPTDWLLSIVHLFAVMKNKWLACLYNGLFTFKGMHYRKSVSKSKLISKIYIWRCTFHTSRINMFFVKCDKILQSMRYFKIKDQKQIEYKIAFIRNILKIPKFHLEAFKWRRPENTLTKKKKK